MRRAPALAAAVVCLTAPAVPAAGPAGAGDPDSGPPAVSEAALDQRLRFIEDRLRSRQLHGQIWHWSWMTIDVASAAVLGVAAARARHEDDAVNNGVQAAVSAIGVADLVFRPLEARYGADRLEAVPETTRPETTRAEKEAKLRLAEDQLRRNAARAAERSSLLIHAANVGLNAAAGLIIALAGRPSDGAIAFATGTAGGVVNILTQPAAPEQDWREYQSLSGRRPVTPAYALAPRLYAQGGGLALSIRW